MSFGAFLKETRKYCGLTIRELSEKSGISNAEISRIETGERQKPSPLVLKALAPHIMISYDELLNKAGYREEVIDHEGFTETVYRDEKGRVVDITRRAKEMYERDSNWANLAYRVSASSLTDTEMEIIKAQTQTLLEQFLKNKKMDK